MKLPRVSIRSGTDSPGTGYQLDTAPSQRTNFKSCLRFRVPAVLCGGYVLFWFWVTIAQGGETNSLATGPKAAIRPPLTNPKDFAAAHERAGRKREAAALYEATVRTNAADRKVLSHRLVNIYIETGETNKALTWAHEVMRDNPDPQAYLAAVEARLGQSQEARGILEREIAANTNATRAVTLRWQLAEVCEKQGETTKAREALTEAAGMAKGTPLEATTQRRLETLKGNAR
jgi:predicted Zn-dependent protease